MSIIQPPESLLVKFFLSEVNERVLEISKTQDDEVGDGTTTVAVLAGELLREGEKLIQQKIHPQHIIKGWRIARDTAKETLHSLARDNSTTSDKFKDDLMNIARTTLSSKLLQQDKVFTHLTFPLNFFDSRSIFLNWQWMQFCV